MNLVLQFFSLDTKQTLVCGHFIFKYFVFDLWSWPNKCNNPCIQSLFNSSKNIWKNMSVVTLDSNKRQGVGRWTECLNRARIGKLSCEDKVLLEERRLSKHPEVQEKLRREIGTKSLPFTKI